MDELAAALVAIELSLQAEREAAAVLDASTVAGGWHESARLSLLHLRPVRLSIRPSWSTIELIRRGTGSGVAGVLGL